MMENAIAQQISPRRSHGNFNHKEEDIEESTDTETSVSWESTDHKGVTDTEDSVSWESTEEEEAANKQTNPDKKEKPCSQDKPNEKKKSYLKSALLCVFIIIAAFSLMGIVIYLVQEERKEVFTFSFTLM